MPNERINCLELDEDRTEDDEFSLLCDPVMITTVELLCVFEPCPTLQTGVGRPAYFVFRMQRAVKDKIQKNLILSANKAARMYSLSHCGAIVGDIPTSQWGTLPQAALLIFRWTYFHSRQ
mmetsp:Transcript_4864/g.18229  ORF Transcript_4864/g.18229 Transcript_4864/m.18229 type:complete len:120 (-) Transcript_4864:1823-2182(-)